MHIRTLQPSDLPMLARHGVRHSLEKKKGNKLGLKRGLTSAFTRTNIKGAKILSSLDNGAVSKIVTIEVQPHASVFCLCVRACDLEIPGSNQVSASSPSIVAIRNNELITNTK